MAERRLSLNELPKVEAVILNWNGIDDTIACLASIDSAASDQVAVNALVIDNGSSVDPTAHIQATFPRTKIIRVDRNVGFAAGCNLGIKQAIANGVDYILLLNNDALVRNGLFETLLQSFMADHSAGIVGPLIYASDEREIDFAGARINFAAGQFEHVQTEPANAAPYETDYVSGACMMLSRGVIERAGLLDEQLFAYFEDVDLCLRARKIGFRLLCVPVTSAVHKGSSSTRRALSEGTTSPLKHYLIARNRTIIVKRYAPAVAKWFYLIVTLPLRACFYTAAFILRRRWSKLRWFWRGTLDGIAGNNEMPAELAR